LYGIGDSQFVFVWFLVVSDGERVHASVRERGAEGIEHVGDFQVGEVASIVYIVLLEIPVLEKLAKRVVGLVVDTAVTII
jgi:hypothetical protein